MDDHLDESSTMFLVSLAADDPERVAALGHIERCARCRDAWRQSQELLTWLDCAAPLASLDPSLCSRTQAAIAEARPDRLWRAPRFWGWLVAASLSLGMVWAQMSSGLHALSARIGMHCLGFELGFGAVAFLLGLGWARAAALELGPSRAALCALSGALLGQWLLNWRCPAEHSALHLLAFHVSGVALAALLAAAGGELKQRLFSTSRI